MEIEDCLDFNLSIYTRPIAEMEVQENFGATSYRTVLDANEGKVIYGVNANKDEWWVMVKNDDRITLRQRHKKYGNQIMCYKVYCDKLTNTEVSRHIKLK